MTSFKRITAAILFAVAPAFAGATLAGAAHAKDWTKVRIATDGTFAPWNFHNPDGTLAGYEIDLANDLCRRMKVECTIEGQGWDGIIPGLTAEKYDAIMGGMSITDKRLEVIDFSIPYAVAPTAIAVMRSSPLAGLPGTGTPVMLGDEAVTKAAIEAMAPLLKGKVFGTQTASTQSDFVDSYFKGIVENRNYRDGETHSLDLVAGRIDGVVSSAVAIAATMETSIGKDMVMAGPLFSGGILGRGTAVGLRKTTPELKAMFDQAIADAIADGTVKTLCLKWFKVDISPI